MFKKAKKVLMIDDDVCLQTLMKTRFAREKNVAFYSAFEGRKGLDMIAKLQPRLILLDWKLPHVSGIEILDQLRKLNLKRLPEVIMVTSRGRIGELEEALEKGAVDYVTKPVRLAHLVDKVVSRLKDKSP